GPRRAVQVDAAKLCETALHDLDELADGDADDLLTLTAAAAETGHHPDSIGRAVRDGRLPNCGRRNAPRVRRRDLARLGASRSVRRATLTNAPTVGIRAVQIARAVVTSSNGGRD